MNLSRNGKLSPHVDDTICQTCRKCQARDVCRIKAIIAIDPGEPPFIDSHRCLTCYDCIPACPAGAIVRPVHNIHG